MKKVYILPKSEVMNFQSEGMIASSLKISSSKSGNQQLGNRKNGYESPIWKD